MAKNERRAIYEPEWFKESKVLSVNASTCGINKDGHEQFVVDSDTGTRTSEIDNELWMAVDGLYKAGRRSEHVGYIDSAAVTRAQILVPCYFDHVTVEVFDRFIKQHRGLHGRTLGELERDGLIDIRPGHGSPSQDLRVGDVPYIKVSDLRAGHVNINPTNLIPLSLAKNYWGADNSGLQPYDLISPERASKNIGEFCVLMPGQEAIVLTREVIVLRATHKASFDQFYLMWAMSLREVRDQWSRIVFMQTNREDVGDRIQEIRVPITDDRALAKKLATPFELYYRSLERARETMRATLARSQTKHHFFI
jgi:hypothetical protein